MAGEKVKVAIVGVSGYTGTEALRLLVGRQDIELVYLCAADTEPGQPLDEVCPWLAAFGDYRCDPLDPVAAAKAADVVLLCTPKGVPMRCAEDILAAGAKCIELPGDFRLRDLAVYESYYGIKHTAPELVARAVYGLPELYREEIRRAELVANPGCYPTGAILALAPLLAAGAVSPEGIIIDAKTGASGGGRTSHSLLFHYPELFGDFFAYRVPRHQHTPEIEQFLSDVAGVEVKVNFTPHLLPVARGILTTAYATLSEPRSTAELLEILRARYAGEPFVRVLPEGRLPGVKAVAGSNFCDIAAVADERTGRAIVFSAIDNLVKGASGQAVQNLNIMFGLDETAGLLAPPLFP